MTPANVQLVDSLIQVILSLPAGEQLAIVEKLLANIPYPSTQELVQLKRAAVETFCMTNPIFTL